MFRKVLVANRGEIARRVIRTCKRLGIRTVAIYSEADREAPHVGEADEAVWVGPPPPQDSYLSLERVLHACVSTGANAVHPGYGFLSEKGTFARALVERGIAFIGPPAHVLDAFGDKMKARHVARSAGTAPVPGTEGPVSPEDAGLVSEARRIGFPLLAKAVGGGGGIGMQLVRDEAGLARAVQTCSDRGKSAFGDPRVYLERYIERPKHIEVQIFGDTHGNVYALGERECSVQRRHQKIIEESPSPAPFFSGEEGAQRRARLHEAAVRVAKKVGYVGAGTCEFVADAAGDFFFLEVNARLQVEHPVTEMVTGLDLVEWQLRVANGEALPDWSANRPKGHSIEARLYAEDPSKGFFPKPGPIDALEWGGGAGEAQTPSLRIESGVKIGSTMTPYYDPMIAKVVAWGDTRDAARKLLAETLSKTLVGPLTTNREFLVRFLDSAAFVEGTYDTASAESFAKGQGSLVR